VSQSIIHLNYRLSLGHFSNHRDTTHADNHHGTLLVELPSAHEGGALVVEYESGNVKQEFKWARDCC